MSGASHSISKQGGLFADTELPVTVSAVTAPPSIHFSVLSSSSSGNCSVVIRDGAAGRRVTMIDAGLSVRRCRSLLGEVGLSFEMVDEVLLTHLDTDHCNAALLSALGGGVRVYVHERHHRRLDIGSSCAARVIPFGNSAFALNESLRVHATLLSHDQLGVACFRLTSEKSDGSPSIGYATDLGKVTRRLTDHLAGVDVLAIESNYCPKMQLASDRPAFLKRRIMGGSGHLSNEQSAQAVRTIRPKQHVVLLHLSRQCNTPEEAATFHAKSNYALTVAHHERPTHIITVARNDDRDTVEGRSSIID